MLGKNEIGTDLTPDGAFILYQFSSPGRDFGLFNLRDGSTRRLTSSATGASYWLSADGMTLLIARQTTEEALATVDLSRILSKAP